MDTPLHEAVKTNGSVDSIRSMLASGADANAADRAGNTPLHLAVLRNDVAIVKLLLERDADVDRRNKLRRTPLHRALQDQAPVELIDLLLSSGADVNAENSKGKTPLHLAVYHKSVLTVGLLLRRGASVDRGDHGCRTPLHHAVVEGELDIAELLVANGADVNAKDRNGDRPLHDFAERRTRNRIGPKLYCREAVLKALLSQGMLVNARNNRGESALFLALKRKNTGVVDVLLKHGADVEDPKVREWLRSVSHVFCSWTYMVAAKMADLPLGKYADRVVLREDLNTDYNDKCSKEIEKLKRTFIHNGRSLHDFLRMRVSRRAAYTSSEELQELVQGPKLEKEFPVYAGIILGSYRSATARRSLSKAAEGALHAMTQVPLLEIIEHPLEFLDDGDLINVIEANE